MPEIQTEICIGDFEDIPAVFDLNFENYMAEPEGDVTEVQATLKFAQLAHITLTPELIGADEVARLERHVEEVINPLDYVS